jgi:hypothetical protein
VALLLFPEAVYQGALKQASGRRIHKIKRKSKQIKQQKRPFLAQKICAGIP